jgi:hypothetical protein
MILVPEPKEYLARLKGTIDAYMAQPRGYHTYLEFTNFLGFSEEEEKVLNDYVLLPDEVNLDDIKIGELIILEQILGRYAAMEREAAAENIFHQDRVQQEKKPLEKTVQSSRELASVIYLSFHLQPKPF